MFSVLCDDFSADSFGGKEIGAQDTNNAIGLTLSLTLSLRAASGCFLQAPVVFELFSLPTFYHYLFHCSEASMPDALNRQSNDHYDYNQHGNAGQFDSEETPLSFSSAASFPPAASFPSAPSLSLAPHCAWEQILANIPLGVAVLDGENGQTLWTNAALRQLLTEGVGIGDVIGWHPHEYLLNLDPPVWEAVRTRLLRADAPDNSESGRIQFAHHSTRNIAYWEWTVQRMQESIPGKPQWLLTVQNVSDIVMNERQLATAVRTSQQARRDAEALGNLAQLVNGSLTVPELLRTIVHEAADYFDTRHAAVLLLTEGGKQFEVGYSIGLQAAPTTESGDPSDSTFLGNGAAGLPCEGTLAYKAIAQGRTSVVSFPEAQGIHTPLLADGRTPATLVTSPIQQNGRVYGVVEMYFDQAREVRDDSISLLAAFADQTAVGLLKADLYEQIATQRGQLQSIFDNAPVGIIYFDTRGVAVTANAAARRHYNNAGVKHGDAAYNHGSPESCSPESDVLDTSRHSAEAADVVGQHGTALLPDLPPQVFENVLQGKPFHASHVVSARTPGRDVIYDVSLVPVTKEGAVVGLLLLTFEVTELVGARQEADSARQEAENALAAVRATQSQMIQMEKMRAVGELAQGVAHDINNALMAVLGYTELAEDDLEDPAALSSHLATIKKAALDATSTVKRLNKFAKSGIATHGDQTDINEVVKDVVQMTRPRWRDGAHKEGRSYQVDMDLQPVPAIIGEPSGLREVLINMIHNALNAMPQGGCLKLSTCPHGDKEVEIEVADTGAGMTPEIMSRIFDPFFTTRGVEGTGLGLAVSWTIIQRHGGTITVESEPGKGTRFFIRLPISLAERPEPVMPMPLPLPSAAPGTPVLVVDDETIVSSVLSSILGRRGYRVTVANSAKEALEKLAARDADFRLMMTDHGMPGMNGLQLIAEVQRLHPGLSTLLLSGWGDTVLQNNVVEAMPDCVLGKPINQSDLLESLSKLIPQNAKQAEHDEG